MAINLNADFNELTTWLKENITDNKSIKACCQEVNKVPVNKGNYFWFMHPDAYKVINIKPIEPKYTRNINGVKYDLVYLGTAGVRNNSSGVNNDHLRKRIKWHLCDNKNISSLCNQSGSTMSTLRNTIGGLISDDLIANNTQNKIDEFLCKYFFIYFVEYPGTFLEVKDEVSRDEGILINVIRPLFNLKNNPNAYISTHITYMIQQRRQKIEKDSKKRCCKEKTNNNSKIISSKPIQNLEKENKVILEIDCVTFEVKRNENISIVADSISNLPTGPCSIELFYSNRADERIYINGRKRNIPTSKRTVSQYFNAPDTANGKIPKWKIVQNEMNEPNNIINKITVKVCKIVNNRNTKPKTENKVVPKSPKVETRNKIQNTSIDRKIDELLESLDWEKLKDKRVPKLLIIGCCDAKSHQPKDLTNGGHINFSFGNSIEKLIKSRIEFYKKLPDNYFSKKKRNRKPADKNYFMNSLNENNRREALDVYGSNRSPFYNPEMKKLYKEKIKNSNLHLLIISGLYGIIKHDDYINDYHLKIKKDANVWGNNISNAVNEYIQINNIDNDAVFYSLSGNYLPFLDPSPHWNNLWINYGGRGWNQANDLNDLLENL